MWSIARRAWLRARSGPGCRGLAGLTAALLVGPLGAQEWDAARALARIRLVCLGDYLVGKGGHPPIGPADVDLCERALQDTDGTLVLAGCRGLAALGWRPFVAALPRPRLDALIDRLVGRLQDPAPDIAYAAIRALTSLDRNPGRGQPAPPPAGGAAARRSLLSPRQCRRIVAECLAMVSGRDARVQWHAASMLHALLDDVGPQVHVEIARSLLAAIARLARRELADAEQERRTLDSLKRTLAAVPPPDPGLAGEMAQLFLAEVRRLPADHFSFYSKVDGLRALARCVGRLAGEPRRAVVDYLVAAVADTELLYMPTSGKRSPMRHHGVEVLLLAVPALDAAELTRAEQAGGALRRVVEQRIAARQGRGMLQNSDLVSIFAGTAAAFAARRRQLEARK